jgi:hypothetical protein
MAAIFTPSDSPREKTRRDSKQVAPAPGPLDHALLDRTPWPANNRREKKSNSAPSKSGAEHGRAC